MADRLPEGGVHRPRNVDWKRAAALLYGDWGTSKAYVIGLAFVAAGFSSLPIILAVCAVTGLVGINYAVICAYFPEGGGVYSAARSQGRLLAVVGALLLIADLTVTAALSGWAGLTYVISGAEEFCGSNPQGSHCPNDCRCPLPDRIHQLVWTETFRESRGRPRRPHHAGRACLIAVSAPHLTTRFLEPPHQSSARYGCNSLA